MPVWLSEALLGLAVVLVVIAAVVLAVVAVLEARHYRRLENDEDRSCARCCRCDSVSATWAWPQSPDGGGHANEEHGEVGR